MTPDQTAVLTAVIGLMQKWPYWLSGLVVIVIAPWVFQMLTIRIIERNQERRFNDVVAAMQLKFDEALSMYKSNVKLVEFAEQIGHDYKELALMVNTALTTLIELVRNNSFCPLVRKHIKETDITIERGGKG